MKIGIKKIFPLILGVVLFFISTIDVFAISFSSGHGYVCYDNNFNYLGASQSCSRDKIKKASNGSYAYCANRNSSFGGNTSYKLDTGFRDAKTCTYYLPKKDANGNVVKNAKTGKNVWKKYTNGDCSSIAGYVIAVARSKGNNATEKWFLAQASLWTYLGKYSPAPYNYNNTSANVAWTNNSKIKKIIQTAWKKYGNALADIEASEKDDVNFSVNVSKSKFYYRPNGNDCSGGSYVTTPIQIVNNENRAIQISIPVPDDAVSVCVSNSSECYYLGGDEVLKRMLNAGETLSIYMSTRYTLNENVVLAVTASYENTEKVKTTVYNSKRYNKEGYQGMIILTKSTSKASASVVHESHKEFTFTQNVINVEKCPDSLELGENEYSRNTSNTPVSKVCANNAVTENRNNPNDYKVYFLGCNCMVIDLGNDRKVNVILNEKVGFQFGTLTPKTVYPGGGFRFAKSGEGISTSYGGNITWRYADTDRNGVPYYYNPNNLDSYDARAFENEIVNKIKEKLGSEVVINISTRDSNDANDTSLKTIPLSLKMTSIDYNNKVFSVKSGDIEMNPAYFSTDGEVSYVKNETQFPISGGNKYYIPLRYYEDSFPFNIGLTNLSLLANGSFYYKADCDVPVDQEYDLYGVRYRSISLSNPFPKATQKSDVPSNWREWYWGNSTNKKRLKNTFKNYPTQPLYQINIDSNKLNQIRSLTEPYTSWSNINADGSSNFVTKHFDKYSNSNSYCSIGRFSTTCDR